MRVWLRFPQDGSQTLITHLPPPVPRHDTTYCERAKALTFLWRAPISCVPKAKLSICVISPALEPMLRPVGASMVSCAHVATSTSVLQPHYPSSPGNQGVHTKATALQRCELCSPLGKTPAAVLSVEMHAPPRESSVTSPSSWLKSTAPSQRTAHESMAAVPTR